MRAGRAVKAARHAHDYAHLVKRWRAVAKRCGLVMSRLAEPEPGCGVYCVRGRRLPRKGAIYLSAGIHGDEPAGTEGLIAWTERNAGLVERLPLVMIPCINPWGLMHNTRGDAMGRDLNRTFQDDEVAEIAALRRVIEAREYALAMTLHEDYDGAGIYLYEVRNGAQPLWGKELLKAAAPHVPADKREMIEGRSAKGGVMQPVPDMSFFEKIGVPEALYFYLRGCRRIFTVETPSEYGLERRIEAHVAVIGECVRRICAPHK